MEMGSLHLFFGWSAYLSAAATIGTTVTGVLFVTAAGVLGYLVWSIWLGWLFTQDSLVL